MSASELHWILDFLLALICSFGGWFMRSMWGDLKDMRDSISELRTHIAEEYVPKNDFRNAMQRIENLFTRIYDKLDGKADK